MNAIATLENAHIVTRVSKAGNVLGQRVHYTGDIPASKIKAALKAADPNMKSTALKAKVYEVLSGKADIAWVTHEALASAARSQGFIPDYTDMNKAGNRMVSRFIKPDEVKASAPNEAEKMLAQKDAEIEALRAELAAAKAKKPARKSKAAK